MRTRVLLVLARPEGAGGPVAGAAAPGRRRQPGPQSARCARPCKEHCIMVRTRTWERVSASAGTNAAVSGQNPSANTDTPDLDRPSAASVSFHCACRPTSASGSPPTARKLIVRSFSMAASKRVSTLTLPARSSWRNCVGKTLGDQIARDRGAGHQQRHAGNQRDREHPDADARHPRPAAETVSLARRRLRVNGHKRTIACSSTKWAEPAGVTLHSVGRPVKGFCDASSCS
jgi:hypothetical protein